MNTSELITLLSHDARLGVDLGGSLRRVVVASIVCVAIAFFAFIGLRSDIGSALDSVRFVFKFVVTIGLGVTAGIVLFRVGRPGAPLKLALTGLLIPLGLLLTAVLVELLVTPPDTWRTLAEGKNSALCLSIIPGLSTIPLSCFLHVLKASAPEMPALAGAVAGLASAGISATFYAANCTDDSPLFVITWYPLAILFVAAVGALLGNRLLRW